MKIRKVIEIYSVDIPATSIPASLASRDTFFSATKKTHETIYFRSYEDFLAYKKQVNYELAANNLLAIEHPEGSNHCILIDIIEKQHTNNSRMNNSFIHTGSAAYDMYFSKSLKQIIADNECSVIEVTAKEKDCKTPYGIKKHIYYDCADDNNTSFIYSSGNLIYLIKPGKEINLTDVSELYLQKEITENQKHMQDLKSELNVCEHKQHEYEVQLSMRRKAG